MDEYISLAKEKYGYNGEQALGMLFWHKHDLERAILDLANFTPFPDEWTVEDKVLFEQAFQFHGKSFHRIRQMVRSTFCFSLLWVPVTTTWRILRLRMEERPLIWRVAVNKLNKQPRTADEVLSSSSGVGRGANNPSR